MSGSDDEPSDVEDGDGESDDGRHTESRRAGSRQRLRTPAVGRPPREDTNDNKLSGAGTPPLPSTPSMSHDDDEDREVVTAAAAAGGRVDDEEAFEDASGLGDDGERAESDKTYATITHAPPPPPPAPPAADGGMTESTTTPGANPGAGPLHSESAAAAAGTTTSGGSRPPGFEASLGSFGLRVVFQHNRTGFEESKEFVAPRGTLIAGR